MKPVVITLIVNKKIACQYRTQKIYLHLYIRNYIFVMKKDTRVKYMLKFFIFILDPQFD